LIAKPIFAQAIPCIVVGQDRVLVNLENGQGPITLKDDQQGVGCSSNKGQKSS